MPTKKQVRRGVNLFIVIVALLAQFLFSFPTLFDRYAIPDDVQLTVYWLQQLKDPALFPGDLLTDYSAAIYGQAAGYVALNRFLMLFVPDPLIVFKLLPFLFVPLAAIYLFRIGKTIQDDRLGFLLVGLGLLFLPVMNIFEGFYKSIASALFILFFYYLMAKRYLVASVLMLLTALFYPIVALIALAMMLLTLVAAVDFKHAGRHTHLIGLFGGAAMVAVFAIVQLYAGVDASFGSMVTLDEATAMPEFHEGGKLKLTGFPVLPLSSFVKPLASQGARFLVPEAFIHGRSFFSDTSLAAFVVLRIMLLVALLGYIAYRLRRRFWLFPAPFWHLLIAALVLSFFAKVLAFNLFYPSRYWRYSFPLLFVLFLGISTAKMQSKRFTGLFICYLLVFFLVPMIQLGHATLDNTLCREQAALHGFLSGLPSDSVIAGHPYDMDCVPTFTSRTAYLTYEHSFPHHMMYYQEISRRTIALFEAYYATDAAALDHFCSAESVDYVVFNADRFSTGQSYFKPYDAVVEHLVASGQGNFSHVDAESVYVDEQFKVVACG